MTVAQIANKVARYLRKDRSYFVTDDGEDLIISALNNVRKSAEKLHDFHSQQMGAWMSVDPATGTDLDNAKLLTGVTESNDAARVKSVETVYLVRENAAPQPIWVDSKKAMAIRNRDVSYRYGSYGDISPDSLVPLNRYPGDPDSEPVPNWQRGYFRGRVFNVDPRKDETFKVWMDVQSWMAEYTPDVVLVTTSSTASATVTLSAAPPANFVVGTTFLGRRVTVIAGVTVTLSGVANVTLDSQFAVYTNGSNVVVTAVNGNFTDWLTEKGSDYLMYGAICECNHLTLTFVANKEGFIPEPSKQRDEAFELLRQWDIFLWEAGRTPMTLR